MKSIIAIDYPIYNSLRGIKERLEMNDGAIEAWWGSSNTI